MARAAVKTNIANWFEIPVNDLDRAGTFYEKVFDVKLAVEGHVAFFPYTREGPGAAGSLTRFESYEPSHSGTLVYFGVDDIDECLRRVNANGGKTLLPKTKIAVSGFGFIAHFEDCEGNRVALHSMK
jgi:predicted enzyme related to lactoylglutathione lyase